MTTVWTQQPGWDSQQIIQSSYKLISSRKSCSRTLQISDRMRGRLLLGTFEKYSNKQKQVKYYFQKWNSKIKASSARGQVFTKILTQQRLSQFTFLYRLKAFCQLKHQEDKLNATSEQNQSMEKNQAIKAAMPSKEQDCFVQIENDPKLEKDKKDGKSTRRQRIPQISKNRKSKDKSSSQKLKSKIDDSYLRGHLRCISQQPSLPLSSQRQVSQNDFLDDFDKRLQILNKRVKVSGLRAAQLMIKRVCQRQKQETFSFLQKQFL